jgi:hypothetical protein
MQQRGVDNDAPYFMLHLGHGGRDGGSLRLPFARRVLDKLNITAYQYSR